jgi:LacI family transcriptional regulator
MAVTLSDVAARAGVSPATVSRVLNGNYPVADATRRRVEKAVRDLDYVVNAHARALLHATSGLVGVIVNDIADPFFGTIARGIQVTAAEMRRLVVLCVSSGDPSAEFAYIEVLRRQRADVVILVGAAPEDASYRREMAAHARGLRAQGARLVLCGRPAPNAHTAAASVSFDDLGGARALASHVVSSGHAAIAYVAGPEGRTTGTVRRDAFVRGLAECGVSLDPALVVAGDFSRQSGFDAVRRLLASGASFTAVCCANDLMALGAMAALREAGLRVPEDVSVTGVDDVPAAQDVGLTTLRLPLEEAGRRSLALAFSGQDFGSPVVLATELVVRESVAGPASTAVRRRSASA